MNNTYLFLIWHSALWCRERIIADISQSFEIEKDIFVTWSDNKFSDNLKAFYGRKIENIEDKISIIKKGNFEVLIVKDNDPKYDYRNTHDGQMYVNTKVFDKKDIYRNWTARNFRIHSSCNEEELKHDLVVLFGTNFENIDLIYEKDTKPIVGFASIDDFKECMSLFGNNITLIDGNDIVVACKCRLDVYRFLENSNINEFGRLHIFGVEEGDIPEGLYNDLVSGIHSKEIIEKAMEFEYFKNDRNDSVVLDFCRKNNYEIPLKKETIRISPKVTMIDKFKREIKHMVAKVKYGQK